MKNKKFQILEFGFCWSHSIYYLWAKSVNILPKALNTIHETTKKNTSKLDEK
jgi:hypothetical protein